MDKNIISKSLWDTANLITGFAVVQSVTFTYACTKTEFREIISKLEVKIIISVIMLLMTAILSYSIWWSSKKQIELMGNNPAKNNSKILKIIQQAALGRIVLIILLLIPVFLALYSKTIAWLWHL